jgi:hypothetical protein
MRHDHPEPPTVRGFVRFFHKDFPPRLVHQAQRRLAALGLDGVVERLKERHKLFERPAQGVPALNANPALRAMARMRSKGTW